MVCTIYNVSNNMSHCHCCLSCRSLNGLLFLERDYCSLNWVLFVERNYCSLNWVLFVERKYSSLILCHLNYFEFY